MQEERRRLMRRKYILFKFTYLFLILLLFFVGYRIESLDGGQQESNASVKSSTEEMEGEATVGVNQEEAYETKINLAEAGCLKEPTEAGVFVETAADFVMPDDSELAGWKVYEFDMERAVKEKTADQMANVLFGKYFPKAERKIKEYGVYGMYYMNYCDDDVFFDFKFQLKSGPEGIFKHRSSLPELAEPEDGNWEECYLKNNEKMLEDLQLGLWDGEQGYLKLTNQVYNSGNATYHYQIELNGYPMEEVSFDFVAYAAPYKTSSGKVKFNYQGGVLTELWDSGLHYKLTNIRDAEMKYTSMQEILKEVMEKERTMLLLQDPKNPRYYYTRIDSVRLGYMRYCYGKLKRKWAFVPVAVFKQTEGAYVIKEKRWEWYTERYCYYGIQLETGEGHKGSDI